MGQPHLPPQDMPISFVSSRPPGLRGSSADLGPHGALRQQGRGAAGGDGARVRRRRVGQRQGGAGGPAPGEGGAARGRVPALLRVVHDRRLLLPPVLALLQPVSRNGAGVERERGHETFPRGRFGRFCADGAACLLAMR